MKHRFDLEENESMIVLKYNSKTGKFYGVTSYEDESEYYNSELNTGQARAECDKFIRNCLMK